MLVRGQVRRRQGERAEHEQEDRRPGQQPAAGGPQGALVLHQAGEPGAQVLHEIDHRKEQQQDRAHLVILPPGDLFIQQQADAAGPHIAQDGAVADVALQQIEGIGEIGGQDLREQGAEKGAGRRGPHGPQGQPGAQGRALDVLVGEAGHDGEGVDRDGGGAGEGAQPQKERGQQGQDQRREGPEHLDAEPKELFQCARARQRRRAGHGRRHRQRGPQGRAGDGHLHRGPQQRQDLAEKAPVRREHLRRDVRQVVPAAPHQPQVTAGEPGRR